MNYRLNTPHLEQPKHAALSGTIKTAATTALMCWAAFALPTAAAESLSGSASAQAEVDINSARYTREKAKKLTDKSDEVTERINEARVESIRQGVVSDPEASIIYREQSSAVTDASRPDETPTLVDAVVTAEGEVIVADESAEQDAATKNSLETAVSASTEADLPWYRRIFQ